MGEPPGRGGAKRFLVRCEGSGSQLGFAFSGHLICRDDDAAPDQLTRSIEVPGLYEPDARAVAVFEGSLVVRTPGLGEDRLYLHVEAVIETP